MGNTIVAKELSGKGKGLCRMLRKWRKKVNLSGLSARDKASTEDAIAIADNYIANECQDIVSSIGDLPPKGGEPWYHGGL